MLFDGPSREGGENICLLPADSHTWQCASRAAAQFADIRVEINRQRLRRRDSSRPVTPVVAWRSIPRTAKPSLVAHQYLGPHILTNGVGLCVRKERRQNRDRRSPQKTRHMTPWEVLDVVPSQAFQPTCDHNPIELLRGWQRNHIVPPINPQPTGRDGLHEPPVTSGDPAQCQDRLGSSA